MSRKQLYILVFSIVTILFFTTRVQAQYSSEEELKTAANTMFNEKNYVAALPLFSQLLSLYPKDLNYNYKYGACILYGSRDKEDAVKYLKFAVTKPTVDPLAFYFLAKAYHHNYQFAPALVNYNKFKEKATPKERLDYQLDREIKMCENGQKLLTGITDIGVLSKKEIKETDFFRSYNLKGIGGKIIVKPDEFKTKLDKKNNETSIIYLSEAKDMVVFSSYGTSGSSGKDIYKVVKLPNGEWSKPSSIGNEINTEFDEDYPYLHPDGKTLYFSSKGFNSMGGFDIFKSTLDVSSGKWSYPENLDFPINTPDDDILYISDIDNKLAYFASSRASQQGELTVYNVTVDAPPTENSVIKGYFLAESNPNLKSATITVKDAEKDRRYGVYTTNNETGEYLLTFPKNGGKFKLLIETTNDSPIHSAIIEIPKLDGFRALKQELRLVGEGANEKLVVKNLFDEADEFDINDPLVVQNIIQQKAKLEVNTTEDELNNLQNSLTNALSNQEEPKSNYKELTNEQLVKTVNQKATKIIEQTTKSKEQTNYSYQIASQKSLKARNLFAESEKLITEAQQIASSLEKDKKLAVAERKKVEATQLINEAVATLNIARILESEVTDRESDIANVKAIKEKVTTDINSGNRSEAENNLSKLDEIASATYQKESALVNEEKIQIQKLEEKQQIYNKTRDEATALLNKELELAELVNNLEAKKETTKNKTEKADLDEQIKALTIDIDDIKYERNNAKAKEVIALKEYNDVQHQVELTKIALNNINLNDSKVAAVTPANKLQLENDILFFEKEGLVGTYPSSEELATTENTNKEVYSLLEHKDEFNVIDENGKLIDYSTQYSVELSKLDSYENEAEKSQLIVKLNQEWIKSIDEEIGIRKNQLKGEITNTNKVKYENRIASLEVLKSEKQKEINENTAFAVNNTTTPNNTEEVPLMNKEGNVVDYNTEYTNKLNSFTGEDTYETYSQKAAIHTNWAKTTAQEITNKKQQLGTATPEQKNTIANEIAVLESNLQEQQEFAALYNSQAETLKTTASVASNPTLSENNSTNEKTTVVSNENKGEDYATKYTTKLNAITGEDSYETFTQKATIYNNWATTTEQEITNKKQQLATTTTPEQKNNIANEIAVLENNLQEQQEFAALFNSQAESLKTNALVADKPTTNENNTTNEKTTNNSTEITNSTELNNNEKINTNNIQPNNVSNPIATSNEITKEDQEVILSLKPEEIATIKNSEDYKTYAELKKENRRLTKEAAVEYVEADKVQQEAKDQQQLGVSLKAMADGASSEEDKAKKLAQIEKLNKMIAENETKSSELKQSAIEKENKAKETNNKTDSILINTDENASKSIAAIEKTETFEPQFLAEAINRTTDPVLDKPIIDKPIIDQPVVDKPIIDKPIIDQPIIDKPIVDQPAIDKPIVDQPAIDKPVVDQPVKTTPTNIDEIPTVLSNSIFVINNTNEAVYNENKKIPVSPKLPEGLVFKVQIGAFRNPIPQNHYKGFAPIMAEDAGNGITRYTAGFFKTFNMANEAKNSIRSIGYEDAFVVAFMNGKRININEARALQNGNVVDEGNFTVNATNKTNINENVVNNNTTTTTNKTVVTEEVKDGVSTDVRNIGGVFYSIQVGVYSKPVTAGQLSNVSPLNSERTTNGLIRYTSGVYKNLTDANSAKDKIRALGITDAFVVAYNGGNKITVTEATQLLGSGSSTVTSPTNNNSTIETPVIEKKPEEETPIIEKNPIIETPVIEEKPTEEVPVTNNVIGYEPKADLKLEFKVKLGEYEEDVPIEDAGLFLKLTGRGVKNYEENNKTIYTIGSFPDYNSALDLQIEMKELGVKKPTTIVFKDGVEITIEQALELMKKNQ